MEPKVQQLSQIPNDLTACENEPLRFIGSVQSIGCLIAFTQADHRIQAASENVKEYVGREHRAVVSEKLEHVIGFTAAERALAIAAGLSAKKPRASFSFSIGERALDAVVYLSEGLVFVEIEPSLKADDFTELMNDALHAMRSASDLRVLATTVCEAVHRITGFERVMMYRFLAPHQHGEVIAEFRVLSAHSYFQQRFPASDIPQIARDLYLRNSVRQIPDVNLPTARVLPIKNPITGKDIDLSDSRLRAVSPIHLEYLRNMKVACSFSVAIVVEGRLWGLIACHHSSPKRLAVGQRSSCDLLGNAFAGQAHLIEANELARRKIGFLGRLGKVQQSLFKENDLDLMKKHQQIFETFRSTGLAIVNDSKVDAVGLCPPRADLNYYAKRFSEQMQAVGTKTIATDSISRDFPELAQVQGLTCGVLAVKTDEGGLAFLFRPEIIETITWGGDPRKQLDRKNLAGRINPRSSFEAWQETIREHSAPWMDYEIEGFELLTHLIFDGKPLASR